VRGDKTSTVFINMKTNKDFMQKNNQLEQAILLGNLSLTKLLIKEGHDVNRIDKYGKTVLYDAIVKGFQDIVEELCLANANVNNQDKNGKTPLHFAAIYNQLEIVKILIQYNAHVNVSDKNGNTPIFDAVFNSKGISDIILLLKENNADFITPNKYGVSPKDLAETIANFDVSFIFNE
jgi:ankyrin repeat protein